MVIIQRRKDRSLRLWIRHGQLEMAGGCQQDENDLEVREVEGRYRTDEREVATSP